MTISIIAAVASNGVIGRENRLPWKLPADLKRFKKLTMGHPLIMGRRTFESIGRPLPGRTLIVLSRDPAFAAPGVKIARRLKEALESVRGDDEVFIGGGAEIYREALPQADRLYLTRIHTPFQGDTRFPEIDPSNWRLTWRQDCSPDPKNAYAYSFLLYQRMV